MRLTQRIAWHRFAAGVAIATALLFAGCAPAAEVIVLAPTETLAGAVVPTRAPTTAPTFTTIPPTDAATGEPTVAPSSTPTVKATDAPGATASSTATASATATLTVPPSATAPLPPTQPAPTDTPVVPTNTWTPPPLPPSATPSASGVTLAGQTTALSDGMTVGSAVSGIIDDDTPWLVFPLTAQAGDVLDLKLDTPPGGLLPVLRLLGPTGREIARSLAVAGDGLALIRGAQIEDAEDYYVVVGRDGSADGSSGGPVELSVSLGRTGAQSGAFSTPIAFGSLQSGELDADTPLQVFTFEGSAGDIITVQTTTFSGDLDTRLELSDSLGNPLVRNDDDPLADTLDSGIYEFVLPADGAYTIVVSRFDGSDSTGEYRLKLTLNGQSAPNAPLQALLNFSNSVTLGDDGTFITDYRAGDQVTSDGQELRTQTLLTFHLPALPDDRPPAQATLELNACGEVGAGFEGLGTLIVYADSFGDLGVPRDYTRPFAGARIIGEADSCAPIDLTEAIATAYAEGQRDIQLRLTFRAANNNQQMDEIRFEPRLLITPAG